jgi:RimJ/RimL family protein N-acetyltransferase
VREKASGRFVGDLGFADFHRVTEPTIFGVPEAGWVLAAWAHGKGYATEALTAGLAWLDSQPHPRSVCIIDPENTASVRVASKIGYATPSTIRLGGEEIMLLERPKPKR